MRRSTIPAAAMSLIALACGPDPASQELRIFGEAYVEDRIPASDVVDGWEIELDEFVVAVGDLTVHAEERVELEGWWVVDLTEPTDGAGQVLTEVEVTGTMASVSYRLGRIRGEVVGGNASPEQVATMREGGYGLVVRGHARRGDEEVAFDWGLPLDYGHACALGQELASPRPGGPTLTIHADHLFLDDLEVDPRIAFDLIAGADRDGDGVVVPEELARVDITVLERYQTGSNRIPDLWSYIGTLAGTMGHVDGEGGCDPVHVPRDYVGRGQPGEHGAAAELYATHCASCHGAEGRGDGEAAAEWPAPTDLTRLPDAALDPDYLLYRISEGGAPFPYHSTMPAFGDIVTQAEAQALVGHVLGWNHR